MPCSGGNVMGSRTSVGEGVPPVHPVHHPVTLITITMIISFPRRFHSLTYTLAKCTHMYSLSCSRALNFQEGFIITLFSLPPALQFNRLSCRPSSDFITVPSLSLTFPFIVREHSVFLFFSRMCLTFATALLVLVPRCHCSRRCNSGQITTSATNSSNTCGYI